MGEVPVLLAHGFIKVLQTESWDRGENKVKSFPMLLDQTTQEWAGGGGRGGDKD